MSKTPLPATSFNILLFILFILILYVLQYFGILPVPMKIIHSHDYVYNHKLDKEYMDVREGEKKTLEEMKELAKQIREIEDSMKKVGLKELKAIEERVREMREIEDSIKGVVKELGEKKWEIGGSEGVKREMVGFGNGMEDCLTPAKDESNLWRRYNEIGSRNRKSWLRFGR